jgi:PEGA domain
MPSRTVLICAMLPLLGVPYAQAQGPVHVEIVATASEYIPQSTTASNPGHAYTDCVGNTSFLGRFRSSGDSGSFSGTADTNTHCSTTFTPPSETTLVRYRKVNYTVARSDQVLYLLSCTQTWKLTARERMFVGTIGAADGGSGSNSGAADRARANARGKWTDCPAFGIGGQYTLTVRNASDARLEGLGGGKSSKVEYLSSAQLPVQTAQPAPAQPQAATVGHATVHVTSSPTGGEIYVDGKFYGNTPSDITVAVGEHAVKVTLGGKEWSRSVQITSGEIRVHAEMASD